MSPSMSTKMLSRTLVTHPRPTTYERGTWGGEVSGNTITLTPKTKERMTDYLRAVEDIGLIIAAFAGKKKKRVVLLRPGPAGDIHLLYALLLISPKTFPLVKDHTFPHAKLTFNPRNFPHGYNIYNPPRARVAFVPSTTATSIATPSAPIVRRLGRPPMNSNNARAPLKQYEQLWRLFEKTSLTGKKRKASNLKK